MSNRFSASQRALQERFGTAALADRVSSITMHDQLNDMEQAFIASRDLFFLSTVDAEGQPTCSYKGGDVGFVRVLDANTVAFPSYDGNGMYLSMGNLGERPKVGLLFIDFETPNRLRLHGNASVDPNDPLLGEYPGADLVVRVQITNLFVNCPRYIHGYTKTATSKYVPKADCNVPPAKWKRIDLFADALPARDVAPVAASGGPITFDEYMVAVASKDG
jgi:predicted pyridoxine 5'-phosphate oxidase superfamily flavin-nucleotide-binding protein